MEFSVVSSSEDDLLSVVEQPASTSVVVLNPAAAAAAAAANDDVVFGSFLVDRNSSTPYTDATQVREIKSITCERGLCMTEIAPSDFMCAPKQ